MRWRQVLSLTTAVLFAATLMVGFQAQAAEARGLHGGFHGGFRHGGFGHFGFRHGHHFRGSGVFVGLGLGFSAFPYAYAYPAYYPPYPAYQAYPYGYYPAYGACYAYDAYGRCISYWPAGSYYYPY